MKAVDHIFNMRRKGHGLGRWGFASEAWEEPRRKSRKREWIRDTYTQEEGEELLKRKGFWRE